MSAIAAGYGNLVTGGDSFVGAGFSNTVAPSLFDGSSSTDSFVGAGAFNVVSGPSSAIVSGSENTVATEDAFIGGGGGNSICSVAYAATIGGGINNTVNGQNATIVGGATNTAIASYSLIGGGQSNIITPSTVGRTTGAAYASIAGGLSNTIKAAVASGARYAFIGGGHGNTSSAFNGVISGGQSNTATGDDSTVPGGLSNIAAGIASFAAGNGSQALSNGAFVWSDDSASATTVKSSAANQFLARAAGGFYLYSSATLKSGVKLAPGSGSWSTLSDRAAKTAIERVDDAQILAKVAGLPISEWSYTEQGTGVRHLGPMTQDFRAAFGLGEDEKHISAVDEVGIALAAIKALQAEVAAKDRKLADLNAKYARLEERVDSLARAGR